MIAPNDTPPALLELLEAVEPTPRHITLSVTVEGTTGTRAYWMTEGGTIFFRGLDGRLRRASDAQAPLILKGLDLARHSSAYAVQGRVADAIELDAARGLLAN